MLRFETQPAPIGQELWVARILGALVVPGRPERREVADLHGHEQVLCAHDRATVGVRPPAGSAINLVREEQLHLAFESGG